MPSSSLTSKILPTFVADTTRLSTKLANPYSFNSALACFVNSKGGIPSRVRKPCIFKALRLRYISGTEMTRCDCRKRESVREASRPAGPAPMMITTYMVVEVSNLYLVKSPALRDKKEGCRSSGVKQKKTEIQSEPKL